LAGDALLTIAFEIVSRARAPHRYDSFTLLREVAIAAGSRKLIAGQVADRRQKGRKPVWPTFASSVEQDSGNLDGIRLPSGAMSSNATSRELAAITKFGRALGLAFQIIDDILTSPRLRKSLVRAPAKMWPQ
jgi:geranylgeranyl pyrophosphate synthase